MTQEQTLPLSVRHVTDMDVPFIFNSWLKSYKETGTLGAHVQNTIFFQNHHKILQKILSRSTVLIACSSDDPNQIYGYIVGEVISNIFVLHYVYVKQSFRRFGVAKHLLDQFKLEDGIGKCFTHFTKWADRLSSKYNFVYHPYIILLDYEAKSAAE